MTAKEIISALPYQSPFLFVDELTSLSDEGVEGNYTYKEDAFFYRGHFKGSPVTPGVILTETMAQIGVVCLGMYLLRGKKTYPDDIRVALTSHQIDFFLPVLPGEKVRVASEKEYFRFDKLKCKVNLFNSENQLVCRGTISGMLKSMKNE